VTDGRRYVSPRSRAKRTLELLNLHPPGSYPWQSTSASQSTSQSTSTSACAARVEVTDDVREWDYGAYEGITSAEIRSRRGDPAWDIWRDGCPDGGENPADVIARLDRVIADIRARWHRPAMEQVVQKHKHDESHTTGGDVMVVAHGHILRALALRWCGRALHDGPAFLLEAGGVGILR